MSPESRTAEPVQYAAFRLRFHALCIDLGIYLGLFFIGGLITGIVFENSAVGRVAGFIVLVAVILGYEPFMIARYGGTIGIARATSGSYAHGVKKISQSGERQSDRL